MLSMPSKHLSQAFGNWPLTCLGYDMLKRGILTASDWNHDGVVVGLLLQTDGEGEFPLYLESAPEGLITSLKALVEAELSEHRIKNKIYYKVVSFTVIRDFNQGD